MCDHTQETQKKIAKRNDSKSFYSKNYSVLQCKSRFWLKRALGAAPISDNSQYSGSWQAGGILVAVQSFRAVGAAAAAQRARGHCDSAFYFGWRYENSTQ